MKDYSGAFDPNFELEDLDHGLLAWYGREVMLANHIHDRGIMSLVTLEHGTEAQTRVACDEWMGSSPVYNARNRLALGIEGDDVEAIFKAFQLDIGAPHTFLTFHYDLKSAEEGFFWLTHCGAYNHVRRMTGADPAAETQICHHMEDPTFDATVMTVNQRARCRPEFRPPHGEVPAEGPCRWRVFLADDLMLPERNPLTDIINTTRAAQFEFETTVTSDDGLMDYRGPFLRDFRLEMLNHGVLARQCREFALNVHLLQKACFSSISRDYGEDAATDFAVRQWQAIAPVYVQRLRQFANIEGDDIEAVLKLLQLDPYLPDQFVKAGFAKLDDKTGYVWLEDCELLDDTEHKGLLQLLRDGEVRGLQAPVQAANTRATVEAIEASDCSPAKGRAKIAWKITCDALAEPVTVSDYTAIVAGADLWDHDNRQHHYAY